MQSTEIKTREFQLMSLPKFENSLNDWNYIHAEIREFNDKNPGHHLSSLRYGSVTGQSGYLIKVTSETPHRTMQLFQLQIGRLLHYV